METNNVYMLLSLNKDEDRLIKSNLDHPIAIKFLDQMLSGERGPVDFRGDENGRIKIYKINNDAEAAFIKLYFGFGDDNGTKAMHVRYWPRVVNKELYNSLIKENDIDKVISICDSIPPECEVDMFIDTTSFIESEA